MILITIFLSSELSKKVSFKIFPILIKPKDIENKYN